MLQRFIELGEGYSDLYELIEIAKSNQNRLHYLIRLDSTIDGQKVTSLVVALKPVEPGNYMPLYICREGIPQPEWKENKRFTLFETISNELNQEIVQLEVKPSTSFNEKTLYYQYIIGVLRMNHFIPPLKF
ncbi:methylthioribose kinase [Alkalihalophilus pseudofirmus]|uniref:DUF7147 family protein n=1 Tax=Alkalihalobacterium alkalinitrilicum TaxID=427920 RepID=UPI00094C8879|nr:methylthioribose kinase [Alkalihalobacterium alkalinitrilicum]OLO40775.1 methylthioribose kinase [Alkalihalophilus pseudofirmus]